MSYHSQCGEDKWLIETRKIGVGGTFVEVGAFDGIKSSNTFALENGHGWHGVLVEADPFVGIQCVGSRRSPTIICACAPEACFDVFRVNGQDHGLSGFKRPGWEIQVPCLPLHTIIAMSRLPKVDLLSIDTEGTELDVWRSGAPAFERIGLPAFVIMEHQTCQEPSNLPAILEEMSSSGYKEVHRTLYNCIFERA
jgi:FkbM family methyltransferase